MEHTDIVMADMLVDTILTEDSTTVFLCHHTVRPNEHNYYGGCPTRESFTLENGKVTYQYEKPVDESLDAFADDPPEIYNNCEDTEIALNRLEDQLKHAQNGVKAIQKIIEALQQGCELEQVYLDNTPAEPRSMNWEEYDKAMKIISQYGPRKYPS